MTKSDEEENKIQMAAWNYKNYAIIQKNRRKARRWFSTATFRTRQGELSLTACPLRFEGYADENKAQRATEKFVRDHIDMIVQRNKN